MYDQPEPTDSRSVRRTEFFRIQYSNTIIVSATAGLLENITVMIKALDKAAQPASSVRVLQVDRRINTALLRERLKELFGPKPPPQQPNQNQQNPNQPNGPQQKNANRRGQVSVSVN